MNQDRRQHERTEITRPAKVYHSGSARYLSGYIRDHSRGGALLEVHAPRGMEPGDELEVLIAWNDRTLLSAASQRRARVTRVLGTGSPRQIVAVEYLQSQGRLRLAA